VNSSLKKKFKPQPLAGNAFNTGFWDRKEVILLDFLKLR